MCPRESKGANRTVLRFLEHRFVNLSINSLNLVEKGMASLLSMC